MELVRAMHIMFGELGVLAFAVVLWELLFNKSIRSILRAKISSTVGLLTIWASWLISGFYYIVEYGPNLKPDIKSGSYPWAHGVFMESKEHIFLFLPFLAILICLGFWIHGDQVFHSIKTRISFIILSGVVVFLGILMATMGYMVAIGH